MIVIILFIRELQNAFRKSSAKREYHNANVFLKTDSALRACDTYSTDRSPASVSPT